ncbi:TraR/DksA C4-type zinc finger protein [Clostridium polynesiense]|uniref:TraR/DksA C4-type zinc finger protein n=1 Tax=Clostridium polynesiense TaxID=1325933 RepID=UPI00058C9C68|nr:TraR/DksA C4-type zinc finger protein [Clostridium polynesiense]
MKDRDLKYFREKLLEEKKRTVNLINKIKENETSDSIAQISSELSFYDNHPADLGDEITEMEKGRAIKRNEVSLLDKINEALELVNQGKYGNCQSCGAEISRERLEFLPYSKFCIKCQEEIAKKSSWNPNLDMGQEETVLKRPFGYGYNDYSFKDEVGFDAEDSYQAVDMFNRRPVIDEYFDDDEIYVEPIESISNEQYRNQLPD